MISLVALVGPELRDSWHTVHYWRFQLLFHGDIIGLWRSTTLYHPQTLLWSGCVWIFVSPKSLLYPIIPYLLYLYPHVSAKTISPLVPIPIIIPRKNINIDPENLGWGRVYTERDAMCLWSPSISLTTREIPTSFYSRLVGQHGSPVCGCSPSDHPLFSGWLNQPEHWPYRQSSWGRWYNIT